MSELDQMKILVVDDDETTCKLLTKILTKAGHYVMTAGGGKAAMRVLEETKADLVLSDVRMPDMSGFDLLKEIKAKHPGIAVIMMTAYADSYSIKDALIQGADEYITKPFKPYEVTVIVERAGWRLMSSRQQKGNI